MKAVSVVQLLNSNKFFQDLAEQDFSINTGMKLLDLARKTAEVSEQFNKKQRAMFEKYGKKNESDPEGPLTIQKKHQAEYEKEIQELIEEKIELNLPMVTIEELEKEGCRINLQQLSLIDWMFRDDQPVDPS